MITFTLPVAATFLDPYANNHQGHSSFLLKIWGYQPYCKDLYGVGWAKDLFVERGFGLKKRKIKARLFSALDAVGNCGQLHTDIVKNSIVLFLAEMLGNSVHEEEHNPSLYNYLEYALCWLDEHPANPNFHLLFLLNLTKYLGFYPDTSDQNAPFFDLQEGSFCKNPSLNPLIQNEILDNFKKFLGMNFDALYTIQLTKSNRRELLKMVILYYRLHVHGFREPKSLAVLNAVFQ